jgi:hypothetical protein
MTEGVPYSSLMFPRDPFSAHFESEEEELPRISKAIHRVVADVQEGPLHCSVDVTSWSCREVQ